MPFLTRLFWDEDVGDGESDGDGDGAGLGEGSPPGGNCQLGLFFETKECHFEG